jgi:hypothetical protein
MHISNRCSGVSIPIAIIELKPGAPLTEGRGPTQITRHGVLIRGFAHNGPNGSRSRSNSAASISKVSLIFVLHC